MTKIDKYQDIMDSRDIIERIEELRDEVSTCPHCGEGIERDAEICPNCEQKLDLEAELFELEVLEKLSGEAEGYSADWQYGATLIRDSYFKFYPQELAEDIGAINKNESWPNDCIDWDQAARELQMDYTSVDFDGVEYWVS